jgi:hypothetical protein
MNTALEVLVELDEGERQSAMRWLSETLGTSLAPGGPMSMQTAGQQAGTAESGLSGVEEQIEDLTPKEFLAKKEPSTDVERMTCLAYYLTKARDTQEFNTADLTLLNTEAAGRRFTNAAATGKNATAKSGYLTGATGKKRQITHLGDQIVEALPDRDAVKAILARQPKRKRPSRSKAKGKAE